MCVYMCVLHIHTYIHTYTHTHTHTYRQTDRQTYILHTHTYIQTDRQNTPPTDLAQLGRTNTIANLAQHPAHIGTASLASPHTVFTT